MKKGMDNYIVGLDVGSATTRMAVGAFRSREGEDVPELQILAAAETPSQGIHRGVINSIEDVVSSISACLEKAERILWGAMWYQKNRKHMTGLCALGAAHDWCAG
jgi:cell division ATPase FtsA